MELIRMGLVLVLGIAIGAWGCRYVMKRNHEAIERLAAQARALRDKF